MITRFDIPPTVANVLNVSVECGVIDSLDVYAICSECGSDWYKLVENLCEYAFCASYIKEAHKKVVKAAEEYWKSDVGHNDMKARGICVG
jgi:hypothetical protein